MRTPRHIRSIRSAALTAATTLVCVGLVAFCAFGVPAYEPDAGGIEVQLAEDADGEVSAGEELVEADEGAAAEEDADADEAAGQDRKAKKKSKKDAAEEDSSAAASAGSSTGGADTSADTGASKSAGAKASGGTGKQKGGSGSSGASGSTKDGSGAKDAGSKADTITVTVIVDSSRAAAWGWPDSLASMQVSVPAGSSVYDALCATGLKVGGSSSYVSSIGGLAERACGSMSGWLYYVDGEWASKPAGSYILSGGETVQWIYTCSNGSDVDL